MLFGELSRIFRRREIRWRLYYDDSVVECLVSDVPSGGAEIRFSYRGELCCQWVHRTRDDAEAEAGRKKRELIEIGWTPSRQTACSEPTSHAG